MRTAMIVCAAIGVITVLATLAVVGAANSDLAKDAGPGRGKQLMTHLAPHRLACVSCHLDGGAEPGDLTLVNAVSHYPGDRLGQRINECVTRNMNAQALDAHGLETTAIAARLHFLADESAAMSAAERKSSDPVVFQTPNRAADPAAGARLFEKQCANCHGKDGAGLAAARDPAEGYLFSPLWGTESFPDASDFSRSATLGRFIKAKMPLGKADLDDNDAYDLAAYILSKPRPHLR